MGRMAVYNVDRMDCRGLLTSAGNGISTAIASGFITLLASGRIHAQAADGSDDLPQKPIADMFQPLSTPAEMIHEASLFVLAITAIIFVVVTFLLFYTVFKFKKPKDDDGSEPPQVYGSNQIELAWTVLPIVITVVLILVTARTIGEVQNKPMPADALTIRLVGNQWWWKVEYPDYGFVTANEIHVPVSSKDDQRITHIILESADVIHSFWVPQLAGKTDLVPNRANHTWIEPHEVGVYFGNCAEYCGTQHAHMLLRVYVDTPEQFDAWVKQQQEAPQQEPATPEEIAGKTAFFSHACVNCHTIAGTAAAGKFGPDLTTLATRDTIAAGAAPLTPETLHDWVRDPQTIKPGALMPDMKLSDQEVKDITAYLLTLK